MSMDTSAFSINDQQQQEPAQPRLEAMHDRFSRFLAGYGAFVTRHKLPTFGIGLALALVLSAALVLTEKQTNLNDLWIMKGTRLGSERDFLASSFGGTSRKVQMILTSRDQTNAATPAVFNALYSMTQSFLMEAENNVPNPAQWSLNSRIGQASNSAEKQYTAKDFCESPAVPSTFQINGTIVAGYRYVLNCAASVQLPITWYLDRFPCPRVTPLDCFSEGSLDMPYNFKLLDNTSIPLATNFGNVLTCLGGALNSAGGVQETGTPSGYYQVLRNQGLSPTAARQAIDHIYRFAYAVAYEWGYTRRASFGSLTAVELVAYINQAVLNGRNSSITASMCRSNGLPCCLNWDGTKIDDQLLFGGVSASKVNAVRFMLSNFHEDNPSWVAKVAMSDANNRRDLALAWDQTLSGKLEPIHSGSSATDFSSAGPYRNVKVDYLLGRSLDDSQDEGGNPEMGLIVGAYIIVAVYSAISFVRAPACSGPDTSAKRFFTAWVYSRAMLAVVGVIVVAISTTAAFGFTALVGINFSPITVNLVPFLSLAIGTDNAFVLMNTMNSFHAENAVTTRMKLTLAVSGPSVILTSFCNAAAMFIAVAFPVGAVQNFMLQMGITICINTIILFLVFVPCLAWDAKRTKRKRLDGAVCFARTEVPAEKDVTVTDGLWFRRVMDRVYGPVLAHYWTKLIIVLVFSLFFIAMAIIGFAYSDAELDLSDIARRNSYVRSYLMVEKDAFTGTMNHMITSSGNYTATTFQSGLLRTNAALQLSEWVSTGSPVESLAWNGVGLSAFYHYAYANSYTSDPREAISAGFGIAFQNWLQGIGAIHSANLYCQSLSSPFARVDCLNFDPSQHSIGATRIPVININTDTTKKVLDTIKDNRNRVDSTSSGTAFVIGDMYLYNQQYLDIHGQLYATVGWAVLGVFLCCLALQFSPVMSILMIVMALLVVIELYGFMYLIDCHLNAYSVVNLVSAVGISIEFNAHISHIFMLKHGSRDYRMVESLKEMFSPIFHGTITNLLAVVLLSASDYQYFSTYYFGMFFALIIIAFLNSVLVLPVLLSVLGPRSFHYQKGEEERLSLKRLPSSPYAI